MSTRHYFVSHVALVAAATVVVLSLLVSAPLLVSAQSPKGEEAAVPDKPSDACHPRGSDLDKAPCPVKLMSYLCVGTQKLEDIANSNNICPICKPTGCPRGHYCPLMAPLPKMPNGTSGTKPPTTTAAPPAPPGTMPPGYDVFGCDLETSAFLAPKGGFSGPNCSKVFACPPGYYCPGGAATTMNATGGATGTAITTRGTPIFECPDEHFCRVGSDAPTPCTWNNFCKSGTKLKSTRAFLAGFITVLIAGTAILTALFAAKSIIRWWQKKYSTELTASPLLSPEDNSIQMANATRYSGNLKYAMDPKEFCFTVDDMTFSVPDSGGGVTSMCKNETRTILENIDVVFEAKRSCALMGGSGAGKSTMCNLLSGRMTAGQIDKGEIAVNGHSIYEKKHSEGIMSKLSCIVGAGSLSNNLMTTLAPFIGFTDQADVMTSEATVKEICSFQASARLPAALPADEVEEIVSSVIKQLQLDPIAHKHVDLDDERISGGQKKRVNVAMELVTKPSVWFLDEPSSGLDSATTAHLNRILQAAVKEGRTVIAVIHQPRIEVLEAFDDLVLLATDLAVDKSTGKLTDKGRGGAQIAYAGPVKNVKPFFAQHGLHHTGHTNLADYIIDIVDGAYRKEHPDVNDKVNNMIRATRAAMKARVAAVKPQALQYQFKRDCRQPTGFLGQLALFGNRSARGIYVRRLSRFLLEIFVCIVGAAAVGFALPSENFFDIQTQIAVGQLMLVLFSHFAALPVLLAERSVASRESYSGLSTTAYLIGHDLTLLLKAIVLPFVFSVVQYSLIEPHQKLVGHIFVYTALSYCCIGSGLFISAMFPPGSAQMAAVLGGFIFWMLSGFKPSLADVWKLGALGEILTSLSPMRWGFDLSVSYEFEASTEFWRVCASKKMWEDGLNPDTAAALKFLALIGLGIVFRLGTFVALKVSKHRKD